MTFCWKCRETKQDAEVVAGLCLQCRSESQQDERPVTALVASVVFAPPRPHQKRRDTVGASAYDCEGVGD